MPDKHDRDALKAELDQLLKNAIALPANAGEKVIPLPMLSMARALVLREKQEAEAASLIAGLLKKAWKRDNYGDYLTAWHELFVLAARAADSASALLHVPTDIAPDMVCRSFERGLMSFALYPQVPRSNRPPLQAWRIFNACLFLFELPASKSSENEILDPLGGKAVPVADKTELMAVWNALDAYTTSFPQKGEPLRRMALLWRGRTLTQIALTFGLGKEKIIERLSAIHSLLRNNAAYSLKEAGEIGEAEALALIRLVSQSYRFLAAKSGRDCRDNVGLSLVAAGLESNQGVAAMERHMIGCRACAKKTFEMANLAKTIMALPPLAGTKEDPRWPRIEAFINIWNGKQAVLQLKTLTLTVDAKPVTSGLEVLLRSLNHQPFSVEVLGQPVLASEKGEISLRVAVPLTVRVSSEKDLVGAFDLPGSVQDK